jgi:hypothetical protein
VSEALVRTLVEAIAADPEAVGRLREALGVNTRRDPVAFTVSSLAEQTGLSPAAIRGAIRRGELRAHRRGSGPRAPWIVAPEDAHAWASGRPAASGPHPKRRAERQHRAPTRATRGPLDAALGELFPVDEDRR